MPIKDVYKSLANINEKNFFCINFSLIVTQRKNKNNSFLCQLFFFELISILVNASMYFNYDFDLSFLYKHTIRW